jgi:hypothetical protein
MKLLLAVAFAIQLSAMSIADSKAVAYGELLPVATNRGTTAVLSLWIGDCPTGPILGFLEYTDVSINLAGIYFHGTRLRSFTCRNDSFLGKVGDAWVDGYVYTIPSGSYVPRVLHLVFNDSAPNTYVITPYTYAQVDIYHPNNLANSLHSRFLIDLNSTLRILCTPVDPPLAKTDSKHGLIFTTGKGVSGMNDLSGDTNFRIWMSSNATLELHKLEYFATNPKGTLYFDGARPLSFQCGNDGFLGKVADIWVEGKVATNGTVIGTPVIAHVIVTDTEDSKGIDFLYVALYKPQNLSRPISQIVSYLNPTIGTLDILCGD